MKTIPLLLLFCSEIVVAQAMKPGVTAWVYNVESNLTELPVVVAGQTPNVAGDHDSIDFSQPWQPPAGSGDSLIDESYVGLVWGWLIIPTAGTYEFRLTADDGARFYFNRDRAYNPYTNPNAALQTGALVADDSQAGLSSATGTIQGVTAGTYPITVEFYQDTGSFRLLLEWKKPGDADFSPVPSSALQTQADQTPVSSDGDKLWFYPGASGGTAGGPGDGQPLTGIHPSFTLGTFRPPGVQPGVAGMDFLPDGRMVISSWTPDGLNYGAVYLVENYQNGNPATTVFKKFAEGLGEPLGLKVVDGVIHVAQKREITRLVDTNGDDWCDEYIAVSHGWPMAPNYHEVQFNLVEKDGSLWTTTSVPLKTAVTAYSPSLLPAGAPAFPSALGAGSLIKVNPATGVWEIAATGLRTPNGMGLGPEGEMFGCDNQGSWLPASLMRHYHAGANYNHQATQNGTADWERPVLWLEHGRISLSSSQPALIPSGPYAGQMVIGELTQGGVRRANLEKINGVWQGCAYQFTQGLEVGINRLAWGPDGALYVGGVGSNGNWSYNGTKYGIQQLKPNGATTFEILHVKSRAQGFEMAFTQAVPFSILSNPANYEVSMWQNVPQYGYGAGQGVGRQTLTVASVAVSADRKKVQLTIPGLARDRCVYLRVKNFRNDSGISPWITEAWYTLNENSPEVGPTFEVTPINPNGSPPEGAIVLFDGTGTSEWEKDGTNGGTIGWSVTAEGHLKINQGTGSIRTVRNFNDYHLHLEWRSPAGGSGQEAGNSGVKLAQRYEIQILNTPPTIPISSYSNNLAGSIYEFKSPDSNASLGPGQWQTYDIWLTAPRWNGAQKTSNARITAFWNGALVHNNVEVPNPTGSFSPAEAPGIFPFMLQDHASTATGDVMFRNIWVVPGSNYPAEYALWLALNGLSGIDAEPDADPDKDGIPNAWEFATRSNPGLSGLSDLYGPLLPQFAHDTGETFRFIVRRRTDHAALGLQFQVQGSADLGSGSWIPITSTTVGSPVPAGDGVTEFVTLEFTAPAATTLFFRVGLDLAP